MLLEVLPETNCQGLFNQKTPCSGKVNSIARALFIPISECEDRNLVITAQEKQGKAQSQNFENFESSAIS